MEQERQRGIRLQLARFDNPEAHRPRGALATGFPGLDRALGSGFPRGAIVEIFGSSCGKTTLLLQAVAELQSSGGAAAWIDADRTFDPAYAQALGVAIQDLPVARPDTSEQAFEMARHLASAVDLVVFDSTAALVSQVEMTAGFGSAAEGLRTCVLASGLRRLSAALVRTGGAVVFVNQTRARDAAGGEGETSAGGPPLKLYAAVRIEMCSASRNGVSFRVLKNRGASAFATGLLARHGVGFAKPA